MGELFIPSERTQRLERLALIAQMRRNEFLRQLHECEKALQPGQLASHAILALWHKTKAIGGWPGIFQLARLWQDFFAPHRPAPAPARRFPWSSILAGGLGLTRLGQWWRTRRS